jgi:hypothetical protein
MIGIQEGVHGDGASIGGEVACGGERVVGVQNVDHAEGEIREVLENDGE